MTQWYSYPLDAVGGGYGQIKDPLGNYWKPDTNIAIPAGIAITTWVSGVITDVSNKGFSHGGLSVTMRLDHPPNSSARYASFNYLGAAQVHTGQMVQSGQQIGTAGSPTGINFALALGPSPTWGGGGSFPQGAGNPLYNPHLVLDSLRSGNTNFMSSNLSSSTSQASTNTNFGYISMAATAHDLVNNLPGFVGVVDALDAVEQFQLPNFSNISLGDIPDLPANLIQDVLGFLIFNTVAALVRFILMFIATMIIIALVLNAVRATPTGETALAALVEGAATL